MESMVLSCSVVSSSCNPMDYSLSGSCPWMSQIIILEWVAREC